MHRKRERDWVYYKIWAFIIPISKTCVYVCMHVHVCECVSALPCREPLT